MSTQTISEQISSQLLTSAQAAKYCGYSRTTWDIARSRGWIGRPDLSPPEYIRINQCCVMYEKRVLDEWLAMYIKEKFRKLESVNIEVEVTSKDEVAA